jgi:hypothetical protein
MKFLKSIKLQKLGEEWSSADVKELAKLPQLQEIDFLGTELSREAADALLLLADRKLKLGIALDDRNAVSVIAKIGSMIAYLTLNLQSPLPVLSIIPYLCFKLRTLNVTGTDEVLVFLFLLVGGRVSPRL